MRTDRKVIISNGDIARGVNACQFLSRSRGEATTKTVTFLPRDRPRGKVQSRTFLDHKCNVQIIVIYIDSHRTTASAVSAAVRLPRFPHTAIDRAGEREKI